MQKKETGAKGKVLGKRNGWHLKTNRVKRRIKRMRKN